MALWSNKTVQVPGLTAVYASSGPITAQNRRHYILDTTAGPITINLPSGIDGFTIRITDAKGTFLTNNATVVPAIGEKINLFAINETLVLDANELWIELIWNAIAGSWILNAPGILGLIADSFSDYPYITSPSAPASSTLRLYAKTDGKLYVKDSANVEKKVGGGLDHPTTGSTFEVDSYNSLMTGSQNTAIGVNAGNSIINASSGTFIGADAGTSVTTGNNNTAVGQLALLNTQTGFNNVAVGAGSFLNITDGANNVGIGSYSAQSFLGSSSFNTIIGTSGSATAMTRSGTVAIGTDSTGNEARVTADNQFVLGALNHRYYLAGKIESDLLIGSLSGAPKSIKFHDGDETNYVALKAPTTVSADVTWTLPSADGSNNQVLVTNGSGILSWTNVLLSTGGTLTGELILGPIGTLAGQTGIVSFRELAANGTHAISLKAPDGITSSVTFTLPSADGTSGQFLTTNGTGQLSWSSVNTSNSTIEITQAAHGFTSADIGRPVYLSGATYVFARADLETTAEVAGLINNIIDINSFKLCLAGEVASVGANLIVGGGALVAGELYFLSASVAGRITSTAPSVAGQISKPVGIARSSSALDFFNMRGSIIGAANARTTIALTNNSITTVQDVSLYDGGELCGWVYIDGTTDSRFYISLQFSKLGSGLSWDKSYDTVGDTPPSGFSVDVTNSGVIQITMPNIAGFSSANINFALNAPAVGVTLPLSINSSNIIANYKQVTSTYTITSGDYYISATGSSGYTVSLPPAADVAGKMFVIKSRLNAGQILTIDGNGSETIDGSLTTTLYQNASLHILSNGTSWEIF